MDQNPYNHEPHPVALPEGGVAVPSDEYFIWRYLEHAGYNLFSRESGVHLLLLEVLEFRRTLNDGLQLDLGNACKEPLCVRCNLPEAHHEILTVKCLGYEPPED